MVIAAALKQGYSVERYFKLTCLKSPSFRLYELTKIDRWFLFRLQRIIVMERDLTTYSLHTIPPSQLLKAKQLGFSDAYIGQLVNGNEIGLASVPMDSITRIGVRLQRCAAGIGPFVKQIDTVAAEYPAYTNYLYLTLGFC